MGSGEGRHERAARDARVVAAVLAGETHDVVAKREHISVRRVGQIVKQRPGLREEVERRRQDRHAVQVQRILGWSQDHPHGRVSDAAADLGVPESRVRAALGDRLALHTTPPRSWDDEDVRNAVATYVASCVGRAAIAGYRTMARAQGWPSVGTVVSRYGSWTQAKHAAARCGIGE